MQFGIKTETGDITGFKIGEDNFSLIDYSKEKIESLLKRFIR